MLKLSHLSMKNVLAISLMLTVTSLWLLIPFSTIELISNNLPFREAYHLSFFGFLLVYAIPIALGFLVSTSTNQSKVQSKLYYINASLIISLILSILPLAVVVIPTENWLLIHSLGYYPLFTTFLILLGMIPALLLNKTGSQFSFSFPEKKVTFQRNDVLLSAGFGLILFTVNLIPLWLSDYLVGADVYYHAAKTLTIINGESIDSNPFFTNGQNYYYSIVYYLQAFVHQLTGISLNLIWQIYVPLCSLFFASAIYLFFKKVTGTTTAAVIAMLFIIPFNQILWADPSARALSYMFFSFFLLAASLYVETYKKIYLFLLVLFWLLTAGSHPEIAIHIILISIVYAFITLLLKKRFFKKVIVFLNSKHVSSGNLYIERIDNLAAFIALASGVLAISSYYVFLAIQSFPITQIIIVNEIPLSLYQPVGIISFIAFILAIAGAVYTIRSASNHKARLTMSISMLSFTGLFYFTYLWPLYHRYFFETGYIGLIIIASMYLASMLRESSDTTRRLVWLILINLILISCLPKLLFILNYSTGTHNSLSSRQHVFDMIQKNTETNDIIMINPNDILNRYVPFYAERRIFAGSSLLTKEKQWQVLSFCNGPYSRVCDERDVLATEFYAEPSIKKIEEIRGSYPVDYILMNKLTPGENERFQRSTVSKLEIVDNSDTYIIYKVEAMVR